ncbi:MAG TPA: MFS transporter [Gammaproteobacteria bacterium]|nr:MFS transporter [Gammaproteobacteria bacterium]
MFLPTFASSFGTVPSGAALSVNTIAQAMALAAVLLAAWASDRLIRRRTLLMLAFGAILITAVGFFRLPQTGSIADFWVAQALFGVMLGVIMGTAPAMLAELFRSEYRLSGYSLTFNTGLGIGGGTAPLIATALNGLTGHALASSLYLMLGAGMSIVALLFMVDRSREPLR